MTPEELTKDALHDADMALHRAYDMAFQDLKLKVTSYNVGLVLEEVSHALERVEKALEELCRVKK